MNLLDKCRIIEAFKEKDQEATYKQRKVTEYLSKLPTCSDYDLMFHIIGDVNKSYSIKDWNIIALKQIVMDYDALQISNINTNICLFAYSYVGMGHTLNIYYNKLTEDFIMVRGGGSNAWEQKANLEFLKNIIVPLNKSLSFSLVLDILEADYDIYIQYLHEP